MHNNDVGLFRASVLPKVAKYLTLSLKRNLTLPYIPELRFRNPTIPYAKVPYSTLPYPERSDRQTVVELLNAIRLPNDHTTLHCCSDDR